MAEQDVNTLCAIRNRLKNERRKLETNGKGQMYSRVYEMEADKESRKFELPIKRDEPTVNKLKMLGRKMYHYEQTKTSDGIGKFAIKSHEFQNI
jgi:hypothetical protein